MGVEILILVLFLVLILSGCVSEVIDCKSEKECADEWFSTKNSARKQADAAHKAYCYKRFGDGSDRC